MLARSLNSFYMQTFNEFFIRELKPGARPIACIDRDDIAVCAADCRLMAYETIEDSQRFWIKVNPTCLQKILPAKEKIDPTLMLYECGNYHD